MQEGSYAEVLDFIKKEAGGLGAGYHVNAEKIPAIQMACGIFDQMVHEFDCSEFTIGANKKGCGVTFVLECFDMVLRDGTNHMFFDLISVMDLFRFSKAKENTVRAEFVMENVWRCD